MNRIDDQRIIERYAYCLCLHVRPGTIFIGVINLAESLLCGVLFLVALIYQHSLDDAKTSGPGAGRSAANSLAVVIYLMAATVSAMLLFGVVKSRPSYLMPFFWIRLCDFFFSLPAFLSSLYANPAYATHWDQTHPAPPAGFMDVRRMWPPGTAGTHSLLVSTCVILFKGYFLCVVWKCYRYLKMREMILPLQLSFPTQSVGPDIVLPPGFMPPPVTVTMSPPDYETATKGSSAPPDYETAIRQPDLKVPASPTPAAQPSSDAPAAQTAASDDQTAADSSVIEVHVAAAAAPIDGREVCQQAADRRMSSEERKTQNRSDDAERGDV